MSASTNDKITDVRNAARPNSARVTSGRSAGGATLACDNLSGWPTASKVHFVTYKIDSNSAVVAGTQLDCYGIVSGNNIGSFNVVDGTDTGHAVGDVVEMLPTAAWGQDLADALTVGHTRAGAHVASLPLTTPILTTPTIADFTSATHTHATTAQGGNIGRTGFDWTTLSLNMKSATNSGSISPTNTSQDLAGNGVTVSFTVGSNCNAMVSISIGLYSSADFEFRPEIRVDGVVIQSFTPAAALSNASSRAIVRGFTYSVPLTTGAHTISAGVNISSGAGLVISAGAATISVLVLGNVTA